MTFPFTGQLQSRIRKTPCELCDAFKKPEENEKLERIIHTVKEKRRTRAVGKGSQGVPSWTLRQLLAYP